MSTLQVANIWFESTANNRIQYGGSNVYNIYAGSNNVMNVSSAGVTIPVLTCNPNQFVNVDSTTSSLLRITTSNTQQNNYIGSILRFTLANAAVTNYSTDIVYAYGPTTDNANTTFSIQQSNSVGGFVAMLYTHNYKSNTANLYTSGTTRLSIDAFGNTTVTSNNLNLGTSTIAANGYTYLPNGLKMNWGWVAANTIAGNATFTSAFTTACYSITTSAPLGAAANVWQVAAPNTTVATIRTSSTANPATSNIYYIAIGV